MLEAEDVIIVNENESNIDENEESLIFFFIWRSSSKFILKKRKFLKI